MVHGICNDKLKNIRHNFELWFYEYNEHNCTIKSFEINLTYFYKKLYCTDAGWATARVASVGELSLKVVKIEINVRRDRNISAGSMCVYVYVGKWMRVSMA